MAEPDDDDYFPNDFDGLDFESIPALQAPTRDVAIRPGHQSNPLVTTPSPAPSTRSNSLEDMDPSFLAAVDALEARALGHQVSRTESDDRLASTQIHSPHGAHLVEFRPHRWCCLDCYNCFDAHTPWLEGTSNLQACGDSIKSPESSSTRGKGKKKAEPPGDMDIRAILAGYETELTCPICCDLIVGAQAANPCGHTCCGPCLYEWLTRNKHQPTCAVCRSRLSSRRPLLPNFSIDNLVHQHLQVLAKSGRPEWQEKGYKTIEWNKRLESWKKQASARAAKEKLKEGARPRRRRTRHYDAGDYSYSAPWSFDESMDEEGVAFVARLTPRRGVRSRH